MRHHDWGPVMGKETRVGSDGPVVGVTLTRRCRECGMPQVIECIEDGAIKITEGQDAGECPVVYAR